ncbi:hypothetical protein NERG_01284 [Nematocida ausubeli]|uniref:Uncharacterized protein n=1 Tax=Nematocida ausubeli (strain ATCC PRA-371 / ERTm2) TaxID=1913371 RepID=H8ZC41_NEMA1|nr:hypothetical protein NERG_01284 [Nematocida ausubeli]
MKASSRSKLPKALKVIAVILFVIAALLKISVILDISMEKRKARLGRKTRTPNKPNVNQNNGLVTEAERPLLLVTRLSNENLNDCNSDAEPNPRKHTQETLV